MGSPLGPHSYLAGDRVRIELGVVEAKRFLIPVFSLESLVVVLHAQLDVALLEGAAQLVKVFRCEVVLERERLVLTLLQEALLGGLVEQILDVGKLKQLVQDVPFQWS